VQRLACFNPILGSLWPGPEHWGRKVAVQPIHAGGERVGTLLLPDCKPASPTPACVVGLVVRETERTILPGGFYVRFSEAPLNCMKIQTTDFQYADNDMEMVQLNHHFLCADFCRIFSYMSERLGQRSSAI